MGCSKNRTKVQSTGRKHTAHSTCFFERPIINLMILSVFPTLLSFMLSVLSLSLSISLALSLSLSASFLLLYTASAHASYTYCLHRFCHQPFLFGNVQHHFVIVRLTFERRGGGEQEEKRKQPRQIGERMRE